MNARPALSISNSIAEEQNAMKKFVRAACGAVSAGIILLLAFVLYIQASLPDDFFVAQGEEFIINSKLSITASSQTQGINKGLDPKIYDQAGNCYNLNLNLFDSVPIKQVQVQVIERKMVVPGGSPFGIKMFTDGVMIVGMSDIQVGSENVNPAKDAGLKIGDIITHIDDIPVSSNADVKNYISGCDGTEVKLNVNRGEQKNIDIWLQPILSKYDNAYKAGIWVRDSSAGIGTMTYYEPDSMKFAGLGHAICDVDTGDIMPLSSGEIVDVNISGIHAGQSGKPGELKGTFSGDSAIGTLSHNTESGIFGQLNSPYFGGDTIPMALKQEVQTGPAVIFSTISGNKPQSFDIVIEKVNYSDVNPTKNMVIKITDEKLLSSTGGIVQGMSGSPIVQEGKLVGAITHVFVNDPTRGYGIFAENMDKELKIVEKNKIAA